MKNDIYSLYLNNQNQLGFWIKKNNWQNFLAKIVKIRGVDEGDTVDEKNKPSVIAFLLDLRTNEWEECIEINNPEAKKYMQVEYNIVPKNILPEPILKYATSRFKI